MKTVLTELKQSVLVRLLQRITVLSMAFHCIHSGAKSQTSEPDHSTDTTTTDTTADFTARSTFSDSTVFSSNVKRQRLQALITGGSIAYGASLTGLNFLWYADQPSSSFHFFNDNAEWQQIDKVGSIQLIISAE